MRPWLADPAPDVARAFASVAATRMAGVALCNPRLRVEIHPFRPTAAGQALFAMPGALPSTSAVRSRRAFLGLAG